MKRIKQITESKVMITGAFIELLEKYDYNDITLTEIADNAGLTRMTLFRHFKNKEAILHYMIQNSMNTATDNLDTNSCTLENLLRLRFEKAQQLPLLQILIENKIIVGVIHSYRKTEYRELIEQFIGCHTEDNPYLFHCISGGINNIILEWITSGCKESAKEITDKIMLLLNALI